MIEDVEELRAELHVKALVDRDRLKRREIKPGDAGSHGCSLASSQILSGGFAPLGWGSTQRARLLESRGISDPIELPVRVKVQA